VGVAKPERGDIMPEKDAVLPSVVLRPVPGTSLLLQAPVRVIQAALVGKQ